MREGIEGVEKWRNEWAKAGICVIDLRGDGRPCLPVSNLPVTYLALITLFVSIVLLTNETVCYIAHITDLVGLE